MRLPAWLGFVMMVPSASLPAQAPAPGGIEFSLGFTMQTPPDVNLPPLCTEMSLYCTGSGREFPDMGFAVTAARYWKWFGLTTEAGFWGNNWRTGMPADSQKINWVQYAMAGPVVRTKVITYGGSNPHYLQLHAQVLAGGLASTLGGTAPALQVGAGITGWAKTNLWIRLQHDYSLSRDEPRDISGGRVLIAVVFTPVNERNAP